MNHLSLLFVIPYVHLHLLGYARKGNWRNYTDHCNNCGKRVAWNCGVVCANFGRSREGFSPCKFICCGGCYTPHRWDKFKIQDPAEVIEGELSLVTNDEERKQFREARAGDHTMRMFQCDQCQFQNCYFRHPNDKVASDELALCCIRRAN